MKKIIKTVKELKELLRGIPEYTSIETAESGELKKGVEIDYSEGSSISEPYLIICD